MYDKWIYILKKGDLETYLNLPVKWLDETISFCRKFFADWLVDPVTEDRRQELYQIFSKLAGDEGLSYFELHNLISDNIDLTKYSDTLFSAQTDVYNKLVNLKSSPLIFDKWGNVVADDPESGVYNI